MDGLQSWIKAVEDSLPWPSVRSYFFLVAVRPDEPPRA